MKVGNNNVAIPGRVQGADSSIKWLQNSKIARGNADITLDAYGNTVEFKSSVVSIDPAETIIDGVATYKTIIQFSKDDKRIKPGMTANIDIETDKKESATYVPARAVFTKNGKRYVKILLGEDVKEIEVRAGVRGSEANIEIISGVKEGDKIII